MSALTRPGFASAKSMAVPPAHRAAHHNRGVHTGSVHDGQRVTMAGERLGLVGGVAKAARVVRHNLTLTVQDFDQRFPVAPVGDPGMDEDYPHQPRRA
jgi:hypothetical protein